MSLECAVEMDGLNSGLKSLNKQTPIDLFDPKLYRQKALVVGDLEPERYRNITSQDEILSPTTSPIIPLFSPPSASPVATGPSPDSGTNSTTTSPPTPQLIISPSYKTERSRKVSIEGVTMMDINSLHRDQSVLGRLNHDENSPPTYRVGKFKKWRNIYYYYFYFSLFISHYLYL